jgi:hypothetical protein
MIRPISKKRAKQLREYKKLRKEFLKDKMCAVYPQLKATDVHHRRGRIAYLLDQSTWLAVSRQGHTYIEEHPKEAYEKGWSELRTAKY